MKRVKLFALISLLFIGLGHAWGAEASVDDVLWQEQFTGTTNSTSTTFSASNASAISGAASSEKGTSMLVSSDISSLKYTASNVMLTATSGTNCSAAHIWLNKSTTGYFQVENIPLYGATKVKVSWAQGGNTKLTVQYAFDGSSSFADLSSNSTGSAEFVSTELSTSEHNSISLKFVRTSTTTNLRLDNLKLFVTEASGSAGGVTYKDYLTECADVTTYTATASVTGNGEILISCDLGNWSSSVGGLTANQDVYFIMKPNEGYSVTSYSTSPDTEITDMNSTYDGCAVYSFLMPAADVTVSATFKEEVCAQSTNVTFDLNGDSGECANQDICKGKNKTISCTPTREGYRFDGWFTAETDGDMVFNSDGTMVLSVNGWTNESGWSNTDANATLYAHWTEKKTTITLSKGAQGSGGGSATITWGSDALNSFDPVSYGGTSYRLIGYSVSGSPSKVVINPDGTLNKNIENYTDGDGKWIYYETTVTLVAQWQKGNTITWSANGSTYATTFIDENGTLVLPAGTPTSCDEGYTTFMGWYSTAAGTSGSPTTDINACGTKATTSIVPDKSVTYYAVWADGDLEGGSDILEVELDFSNKNNWSPVLPTTKKYTTTEDSYTTKYNDKNYTVKIAGDGDSENGWYFSENNTNLNNLVLGKQNSYLKLPAFEFPVSKIVCTSPSGTASGKVTWNVFVGENAVSTELTGCTTGGTFEISAENQVVGNIFQIKVLNANNLQFKKIQIYSNTSGATGYISSCCTSLATVTVTPSEKNLILNIDGQASTTVRVEQEGGSSGRYYAPTITPSEGATTNWSGSYKESPYEVIFTATAAGTYIFKGNFTETSAGCAKYGTATISVVAKPILNVSTPTISSLCGSEGDGAVVNIASRYLDGALTATVSTEEKENGGHFEICSTESGTYATTEISGIAAGGLDSKVETSIYVRYVAAEDETTEATGTLTITDGVTTKEIALSTTPTCGPNIKIAGNTYITTVSGSETYTNTPITITGKRMPTGVNKLRISYIDPSDNVYSAKTGDNNVSGSKFRMRDYNPNASPASPGTLVDAQYIPITPDASGAFSASYYLTYTPSNNDERDNWTLKVEALQDQTPKAQHTITVYGRSLPETFVLAVNTGNDEWVAVPADMIPPYGSGSGCTTGVGTHDPYPITVDDPSDPTKATIVPTRAVYKGAARCTPTTNPWTVRFESQSQTGYYLWGSASVAGGTGEEAATGDALTTIANQSYSASERTKWVLETKDNTTYQIHLDATLNTNKLGYNGTANRIGQYKNTASSYKYDFRILPIEGDLCEYYINPLMTYSAYDATHSTLSIPYDGTTAYEYSTDGKSNWTAVTGTIDCKNLNLEFDNATVEGKELWLRAAGTICNGDATSETATHMLNPTITATTPQTFTGVQNTAFTGSFTINLSDIWTGAGGGVTVTSSNSEIAATLSSLSGSTSYTGDATINLSMGATPAGDYTTTLTISSIGATTQTVNVTIRILSLAEQEFDGGDSYWFYVDGFFCGNAGTDYGITSNPTIYLSYALYKNGSVFNQAWEGAGTFTMYDMTSGTSATSGWYTAGSVDESGQLKLELNQSYFTNAHTYKLVWENTANLTNVSGLKYANCEMTFIYTDNCNAPTALPACVTGPTTAVVNWAGGCDATNATVNVYTKTQGTSLNEVTAFSTTNVKNLQYAGESNINGMEWITNINGAAAGIPSISDNKLLITDVNNNQYYNLFSPKLSNFGTINADKEYKITISLSQSSYDNGAKVTFYIMDCSSNDLAKNTIPTITDKNIQIDGAIVSSKVLSNSVTNTFIVKGLTGTDRIRLLGSESSSIASSNKNVYVSSIKIETNGEQVQVSGSPFSATCADGNKAITGLSANTTYYTTVTNNGKTSNEASFTTYAAGTKSLTFKSGEAAVTEVTVLGGEGQQTDITVAGQYLAGCDITTAVSAGYSVDESGLTFDSETGKLSGTVVFTLTDPAVAEGTYTITDGVGTVYTLRLVSTNCPAGFSTMATDATDITANTATAHWTGSVTSDAGTLVLYKDGIVNRELIENGGFETGNLTGWNFYNPGALYSCKYEVKNTNKNSGSYSLYVSEKGSTLPGMGSASLIYSNPLTLEPGTYTMTAYIKVPKVDGYSDKHEDFVLGFLGGTLIGSTNEKVYCKSGNTTIYSNDTYVKITADLVLDKTIKTTPVVGVIYETFRPFYLDDVSLTRIAAKEDNEPYMTFDLANLSVGNQALSGLSGNTQYRYMLLNEDGCESNMVTFVTAAAQAPTISVSNPVSISAPMGSSSSGMAIVHVTDAYDAVTITSCNDGRITLGSSTLPAEGGALNFTFRPKDGTDAPGDKGTCTVAFITHGMSTPTTLDIEWTVSSGMDPGTELIEVTDISNQEITIEHNVPGKVDDVRVVFNREVSPDDVDENVGDEIFFSKYYEAYMQKKLWAIYNPTGRKISLEGMEVWRSQGSEKDGYSWNHTEAMDLSTMGQNEKGWIYPNEEIIVYTSNEVGTCEQSKADMSTWEPRSSEDKALSFSGDDALLLVRKKSAISAEKDNELPTTSVNGYPISWPAPLTIDAEQWYMLDIIGARSETYQPDCSACKKWNWTNCVKHESVSGDAEGWVGYGYDMSDAKNKYSACDGGGFLLSTNRCLLVRRMDVKSGANALAINKGNMETLNTEWKGSHVPTEGDQAAVSCENFSYVGGYDYAGYYNHYVPLTEEKEYTSLGKNPDGSWSFETEVPNYYCKILRIEVVEKQTINGVEADNVHAYIDYKVPIVVDNTKNTTDKIFKFGGDTCANCDVVIRDKAQLSHIIGGQGQFRDMYVYPGAKLSNEAGKTLQMRSIYMQALNDTVSYAIVENNTSTILSDKVVHTKRIDDKYWYPFSLPYDCDIAAIRQLNGKSLGKYEGPGAVEPSQYGTWTIKYYDGQARQKSGTSAGAGNASNFWIEMPAGGTLKAHQAYLIGLYETDWEGQHKTVLFPPKAGSEYTESGVDKKETTVVNWADNLSCAARHHGWNFVGSPYISMFNEGTDGQGMNNGSVVMKGKISGDDTPYIIETDYVFLSIPDGRDTRTYTQVLASATKIEPFKGYFVQVVDPTTGVSETKTLEYAKSNRTLEKAPARAAVASAQKIFVELNILAPDAQKDNAGILVADHYTASYEIGGDLTKMYAAAGKPQLYTVDAQNEKMAYQALPEPLAHAIPLEFYAPTAGQYILSIARGASRLADAQAVRLLYEGSQVADLLTRDYTISATGRGIVSGYTIDIQRAPEVSTWVQDSEAGAAVVRAEEQTITIRQIPDHATVQIVDMLGRVLLQQTANSSTMHYTVPAVGVYQVVIRSHQTNQVAKVIVK